MGFVDEGDDAAWGVGGAAVVFAGDGVRLVFEWVGWVEVTLPAEILSW